MFRSTLIGVSALALLSIPACAQEDNAAQTMVAGQGAPQIIDAAQVKTRDEAKLYAASEFIQADLNADGKVDKSEFLAYAAVRAPINDPALSTETETAMADEEGATPAPEANADETFAKISKGDDAITESEMVETRIAQFDEADADNDKQLNDSERQQFASMTQLPAAESAL